MTHDVLNLPVGPPADSPSAEAPPAFSEIVSLRSIGPHRYSGRVPEGWGQGRTTYGGLLSALLCRAAGAEAASPDRALRSLTCELFGGVIAGPVELETELLRAGTGLSTVAARLSQGGELCAHLVGNFGKRREVGLEWVELKPPLVPPVSALEAWTLGPPIAPEFTQRLEYWSAGAPPYQGEGPVTTSGWIRLREPGDQADAAWICGLIDAWWPGMAQRFTAPRPSATITFTLALPGGHESLDPRAPLAYRGEAVALRHGYAVETRELWTVDGQLVALNQQTMALLR